MDKGPPVLLFFSGLGADSKLFAFQKHAFPTLVAPDWLDPIHNESLDDYLRRWIDTLEKNGSISQSSRIIVGGASFGGLVAQRAAEILDSSHCILFGSIKAASEAPRRIRWLRPFHYFAFRWIIVFWQWVIRLVVLVLGKLMSRNARSVLLQFSKLDSRLIQWSIRQLYVWLREESRKSDSHNSTQQSKLRIHQIHGKHDRVFPYRLIKQRKDTDVYILENAGHLLTLFEAGEVNRIIESVVTEPDFGEGPDA